MSVMEGAIIYSNLLVLLSIGLTMTYITTAVPNFAQGSFAVFGSYVALTLFRLYGIHPYASIPITFVAGGLLGLVIYIGVLKPLIRRGAEVVILMIATLAVDLILLGVIGAYSDYLGVITKKSAKKFIFTPYDFSIGSMSGIFFVSIAVIALILFGLYLLLFKTKFGVAMRASMENPSLAEIMGVNVETTRLTSWILSAALASLAGALLPFRQEIVPMTGGIIIVSIFASSIVGGLGSIFGALIGGYVVGMSESFVTFELSKVFGTGVLVYSRVVSLIVLIIMLILAPKGIMSIKWRRLKWLRSFLS
ncbi:amino acid/amide ABC transporter membrane protein 1, HAAT family [Archaeoglobus sulfaticallidus PM70-1]|uniref:Amino acid/amide ABC transporter membrane protein 1, HAAT family n=1 Tax=Archaeoglobus sulfaticallidus PM70-1 TaxID=387631 RepID=N0BN73_9EURY|nr:branched-chain amino acid ABC transporter permease [Archaeoglobus sulfaticallidus]AGK61755.1 amino acid/amide ABC transporter membrane protein 1, HAAT family [Archaeoglobus sulfaticallidus PM70-1]